jgi:uncharacterized membrane protein
MTLDSWLYFGHVLSAIVWVGGGLTPSIVGMRVRASGDPNAIRQFAATLSYAGTRVLLQAVVGTLGFGVWLVIENAAWDFGQLWVLLALGLAVTFLIGAVFLSRIDTRLQRLAVNHGPTSANEGPMCLANGFLATGWSSSCCWSRCGTWSSSRGSDAAEAGRGERGLPMKSERAFTETNAGSPRRLAHFPSAI